MNISVLGSCTNNFLSKNDNLVPLDICRRYNFDKEAEEAKKPTPDARFVNYHQRIGDDFHPINIRLDFYKSGKLKDVAIDYTNGKFAKGSIKESYDEDGNNINYEV